MAPRGPAPAPAPLRLLNGNAPGRDSGGRVVPKPPNLDHSTPEPPCGFSGEALAEWNRVVNCLDPLNLLKEADYAALVHHCELWATYRQAMDQVNAEGITYTNATTGVMHKNAALAVVEVVGAQLLNSCREFGLTPSSEQRLASRPVDDGSTDPFADSEAETA